MNNIRDVVVVSPLMKQVVTSVQSFICSKSYEVYDMCNHVGFWEITSFAVIQLEQINFVFSL